MNKNNSWDLVRFIVSEEEIADPELRLFKRCHTIKNTAHKSSPSTFSRWSCGDSEQIRGSGGHESQEKERAPRKKSNRFALALTSERKNSGVMWDFAVVQNPLRADVGKLQ